MFYNPCKKGMIPVSASLNYTVELTDFFPKAFGKLGSNVLHLVGRL